MSPLPTLLAPLLLGVLAGGTQLSDTCPDIAAVGNFQGQNFSGPWHEYASRGYPEDLKCKQEVLFFRYGRIRYFSFAVRTSDNQEVRRNGTAPPNARGSAGFDYKINRVLSSTNIVATDYTGFAIYLTCTTEDLDTGEVSDTYVLSVWTRQWPPSEATKQNIEDSMKNLNLSTSALKMTDQENCPKVERKCKMILRHRSVGPFCKFTVKHSG